MLLMSRRTVALIATAAAAALAASSRAQVVRDGTMGPAGPIPGPHYRIGAASGKHVGSNLFHSFSQFDIGRNKTATFAAPDGVNNIFARVIGGKSSTINGTLRAGVPKLYLINRDGFIFGPRAKLDVQGNLVVTTADVIKLRGQGGAFYGDPNQPSVLTTAEPAAFGFLPSPGSGGGPAATRGVIRFSGTQPHEPYTNLTIVGGDVKLDAEAFVHASRVIAVGEPAEVLRVEETPEPDHTIDRLVVPPQAPRGQIELTESSTLRGQLDITAGDVALRERSDWVAGDLSVDPNDPLVLNLSADVSGTLLIDQSTISGSPVSLRVGILALKGNPVQAALIEGAPIAIDAGAVVVEGNASLSIGPTPPGPLSLRTEQITVDGTPGVLRTNDAIGAGFFVPILANVVLDGSLGGPAGALKGPEYDIPANVGVTVGANLFHSFSRVDLREHESAIFAAPAGTRNIIARVTGGVPSVIDGTLRSVVTGAHLYVMNESGLYFGPHSALDLQGSFTVNTAREMNLSDGGFFGRIGDVRQRLSEGTPSSLQFFDIPAPIQFQGGAMSIEGHDLMMIGGTLGLREPHKDQFGSEGGVVVSALALISIGEVGPRGASVQLATEPNQLPPVPSADVPRRNISLSAGVSFAASRALLCARDIFAEDSHVAANPLTIDATRTLKIVRGSLTTADTENSDVSMLLSGREILLQDTLLTSETSTSAASTISLSARTTIDSFGDTRIVSRSGDIAGLVVTDGTIRQDGQSARLIYLPASSIFAFRPAAAAPQIIVDGSTGTAGAVEVTGPEYVLDSRYAQSLGADASLFSFERFNVSAGETATFSLGASNPTLRHVFLRVTGGASSQVHGTVATDLMAANLYFMNPAGIWFGESAAVDIGGSLVITTASSLSLQGGSTLFVDARAPLPTVAGAPTQFHFARQPSNVSVFAPVSVNADQSLSLVGGTLRVAQTDGGRVNLIALGSPGSVTLNPTSLDSELALSGVTKRANIIGQEPPPQTESFSIKANTRIALMGRNIRLDRVSLEGEPTKPQRSIEVNATGTAAIGTVDASGEEGQTQTHVDVRAARVEFDFINLIASDTGGATGSIYVTADVVDAMSDFSAITNQAGTINLNADVTYVQGRPAEIEQENDTIWLRGTSHLITDGALGPETVLTPQSIPDGSDYSSTDTAFFVRDDLGRRVGQNIFHSFHTLDLERHDAMLFEAQGGNIIVRITGGQPSHIAGTVASLSGVPRIYFLNADGLFLGHSGPATGIAPITASTADVLKFAGGGTFPSKGPIEYATLSGEQPGTFQFSAGKPGGVFFTTSPSGDRQDARLVGGGVVSDGRIASIASPGEVVLIEPDEQNPFGATSMSVSPGTVGGPLSVDGGIGQLWGGDVKVTRSFAGGVIDADRLTFDKVSAGGVKIRARTFEMFGGEIIGNLDLAVTETFTFRHEQPTNSNFSNSITGDAIKIRARDMNVIGAASVAAARTDGGAADIVLTGSLTIDGAGAPPINDPAFRVASGITGQTVSIRARDVTLINGAVIDARSKGLRSGIVDLNLTGQLTVHRGGDKRLAGFGGISARSGFSGGGEAGSIIIRADSLDLTDGAQISSASLFAGAGGIVDINVNRAGITDASITTDALNQLFAATAGRLTVTADSLGMNNGQIAATTVGHGAGGQVDVSVAGTILMKGPAARISTDTLSGAGEGGTVTVRAGELRLADSAIISSSSIGRGVAGKVDIAAQRSIAMSSNASITATALNSSGGDIIIDAGRALTLTDARIAASSAANGGNITLAATDSMSFFASEVTGQSGGVGGSISIDPQFVILGRGSVINGTATEALNDVQVTIVADALLLSHDSRIITSKRAFEVNEELASTLVDLPATLASGEVKLVEECAMRLGVDVSSFIVTGAGGVAVEPGGWLDLSASPPSHAAEEIDVVGGGSNGR